MKEEKQVIPYFDGEEFFKGEEKVYIHLSTDYPKYVGVMHQHKFIEIVYILSGEAMHTVGARQYNVKSGDITLINSEIPHKFTPSTTSKESFVAYDLMFMPEFFDALPIKMNNFEELKNSFLLYSLFPMENSYQPDMYVSGKKYSNYGETFTKIHQEYIKKEKGYIELIRAYVIDVIIHMFRDIEQEGKINLSPEKINTVHKAIQYMQENYNVNLSVGDIANKVFLGPDYFRKLFKQVTGQAVSSFHQQLRIDEACKLLSTTTEPIKDVCYKVGYNDMKTFYEVFKKLVGKTPKEYRENK